jgi:hypothetical protein
MATVRVDTVKAQLLPEHATAAAFLDETGSIAQDRFFAVGCLVLPEPAAVLRKVEKLRDQEHWYEEIKWVDLTMTSLDLYKGLIDIVVASDARFSCFVADRKVADPVERFDQDSWLAYQKLATQLLIGTSKPHELLSVMADNYSTPDDVRFEETLRDEVNGRLNGLKVVTVCRLNSKACDALQLVDVLTGAVTFEHRAKAGLAGKKSAKALLSKYVLDSYGVPTTVGGRKTKKLNVAIYAGPRPKKKLTGLLTKGAAPQKEAPI